MIPRISVLMSVYNAEKYIGEAVESILNQTFRDFEFLIIDDGSTDGSLEILRRYEKQDSRIRLISRPNTGLVVAANEMLSLAKGEFVARMDHDDVSLPERFAKQVAFLEGHPEVLCVGTQYVIEDVEKRVFWRSDSPTDPAEIERQHLNRGYCVLHPTWMVRSAALKAIGGYSEECGGAGDQDVLLKLGEVGALSNVDEVLFRYRMIPTSVTGTNIQRQFAEGDLAMRNAWKRRGLPGEPPTAQRGGMVWRDGGLAGLVTRGWMAWKCGYAATARTYAARAVLRSPLERSVWRLLVCAWLKDPRGRWLGWG